MRDERSGSDEARGVTGAHRRTLASHHTTKEETTWDNA
jgi:hypothetical protein